MKKMPEIGLRVDIESGRVVGGGTVGIWYLLIKGWSGSRDPISTERNADGPSWKVPASHAKNRSCGCCRWKGMEVGKSYGMGRLFLLKRRHRCPRRGKKKKKLKTPVKITCDGSAHLSNFMVTLLHVKQKDMTRSKDVTRRWVMFLK